MKTYEISYTDFQADKDKYPRGQRVVVGRVAARNGISAIKDLLRSRLDAELLAEVDLDTIWTGGSIKRLHLCGITFEANIVRAA